MRDQCVPDYSCCHPELASSQEARQAYWDAYMEEDLSMLNHFDYLFLVRKLGLYVKEDDGVTITAALIQ